MHSKSEMSVFVVSFEMIVSLISQGSSRHKLGFVSTICLFFFVLVEVACFVGDGDQLFFLVFWPDKNKDLDSSLFSSLHGLPSPLSNGPKCVYFSHSSQR